MSDDAEVAHQYRLAAARQDDVLWFRLLVTSLPAETPVARVLAEFKRETGKLRLHHLEHRHVIFVRVYP